MDDKCYIHFRHQTILCLDATFYTFLTSTLHFCLTSIGISVAYVSVNTV